MIPAVRQFNPLNIYINHFEIKENKSQKRKPPHSLQNNNTFGRRHLTPCLIKTTHFLMTRSENWNQS
jgi:hypothetical protein